MWSLPVVGATMAMSCLPDGPGDSASSNSDGRQSELVTRGRDGGDNTQRRACLTPRSAGVRLRSTRTVEAVSTGGHERGLIRAQLGRSTRSSKLRAQHESAVTAWEAEIMSVASLPRDR